MRCKQANIYSAEIKNRIKGILHSGARSWRQTHTATPRDTPKWLQLKTRLLVGDVLSCWPTTMMSSFTDDIISSSSSSSASAASIQTTFLTSPVHQPTNTLDMSLCHMHLTNSNFWNLDQLQFQYLFRECFHCHSSQPVKCSLVGRVQSLQATIMKLASWTLVYHMWHCLDHPTSALVRRRQAPLLVNLSWQENANYT